MAIPPGSPVGPYHVISQIGAGGVEKVSSASVLSPDSLAYLVGAYTDRDLHMTDEVVASLALTGAVAEAA